MAGNSYVFTISQDETGTLNSVDLSGTFSSNSIVDFNWSCSGAGSSVCVPASGSGVTSLSTVISLDGTNAVTISVSDVEYRASFFNNTTFTANVFSVGGGNSAVDDSVTITRASSSDINMTVTNAPTTYTPGTTGSYVFTVSNDGGPSDAQNLQFSDVIPAGMTITSWSCSADTGSSCSGSGGSNNNVNPTLQLDVNDQATITVNASYQSSATADPLQYSGSITFGDANMTDPDDTSPITVSDSNDWAPVSTLQVTVNTDTISETDYTPGATEVYNVVVTNTGPSDVSGITIVDNNLSVYESISWTCDDSNAGATCGAASGAGRLNTTANLADGASITYAVSVTYESGTTTDPLIYEVDVTNPNTHTPSTGVSGSKSLDRDPFSVFVLSLTDSQSSYTPGTTGRTYTAVLTNNGPTDALGVAISDNMLSEFESINWTCTPSSNDSSCANSTGTSDLSTTVDVVKDDNITFNITVDYFSSAVANPLVYTVSAANPNNALNPTSSNSDSDTLARQVNLSISKTGKAGNLVPNEPFTYSIIVTNDGPSDLGAAVDAQGVPTEEGVRLVDDLDDTLINDPNPQNCQAGSTTPCWKYCESDQGIKDTDISPTNCPGNIDIATGAGSLLDVPIRLSAGSSSEIVIYARVSDSTGSNCNTTPAFPGTNELCNEASISIVETATTTNVGSSPLTDDHTNVIVIGTDLVVSKTDNQTQLSPGETNTYEVVVRNDGFINVEGVSVTDVLPLFPNQAAGFVPGSISWFCETSDAGACCNTQSTACGLSQPTSTTNSDVLNAIIDLDSQTEVTFTITGTVDNDSTGTLSNSASAVLPAGIEEANDTNNLNVTDTTSLSANTDISLSKTLVSATPTNSGAPDFNEFVNLLYQVEVTNNGPSSASAVTVSDLLDSPKLNLSTASWDCQIIGTGSCATPGPVNGSALSAQVDLGVGSRAVFNVAISTEVGAEGKVVNVASATATGFDPVNINNSDSVEYSLTGSAELTIDNDDARTTAIPGEPINYTVRVVNEGPDNVFGATVENIFPPQLQDVNWTCSAVSPIPGDLTFFQRSDQSAAGAVLSISPDGNHVYVAAPDTDDAGVLTAKLLAYSRNTLIGGDFGQIQLIQSLEQGTGGIDGLEKPQAMVMDDQGRFVYVLSDIYSGSASTKAIAVFGRDTNGLSSGFGELTYLGLMTDVPSTPVDLQISPDQKHLYVSGSGVIKRYDRDSGTGLLTFVEDFSLSDAGQMVFADSGTDLYVSELSGDTVHYLSREDDESSADFGDLTAAGTVADNSIGGVSDLIISADQRQLYLASASNNRLVVLNRNISTSALTFVIAYDDTGLGLNITETLVGLDTLDISNDGEHLVVGNPVDDSVLVLTRNSQGLLNKQEEQSVPGLQGVSDVAFTADGLHVLTTAAGAGGKSLTVFNRRQPDPLFSYMETEFNGVNDLNDTGGTVDGMLGASAVAVSTDGNHVYVTGLGSDSVVQFRRDKTKGSTSATRNEHLTYENTYTDGVGVITGLNDPDSIAISPNGEFVYVGSSDSATLTVFTRDLSGDLTYVTTYNHVSNQIDGLLGISDILINASSQHLYVAGRFEASVVQYLINGTNGTLTLVDSVANGDVGVSGMAGARSLSFSPDEDQIYVASSIDDSLVVLNRNLNGGAINFIQRNAFAGDQPMDVVASPDGAHVYVVSANDHRLSVFQREDNPSSTQYGQVSLRQTYEDGVNGFNYLQGARAIDISSQGDKLYLGAEYDHAITVLDRDQNSNSNSFGLLSVLEVQIDEVNGVAGLEQLYDLVVTNDTRHVYAAGFADHALTGFVLGSGSSCSAQGTGNISDVVDVGSNGTLTYSINAMIRSNANGQLTTQASIIPPENFVFNNNLDACGTASTADACDQDTTNLIPEYDLSISKTDSRISAVPGQAVTYEILVSNNGPSDAISSATETIQVLDILNSGFDQGSINWTCQASGSGSLGFAQVVKQGVLGIDGLTGVAAVEYVADLAGLGPHVVTASVLDDSVGFYAIDQLTGLLSQQLVVSTGSGGLLDGARDLVVIDADIYVASQVDDALVALKATNQAGSLAVSLVDNYDFSDGISGLNQAVNLVVSSDGTSLYVAGANDNSVVIFDRSVANGTLTYNSTLFEDPADTIQQTIKGLSGVNALAIAADGRTLYTSGVNQANLGVYKRSLMDGSLQLIGLLDAGDIGESMSGITSMLVSDDNKQLYVAVGGDNKILVFDRDITSDPNGNDYGLLSLSQSVEQNQAGVVGLISPQGMEVSADGRHVYVTGEQADALVWLSRDLETGALSFGGVISDGVSQTDGLDGAIDVTISPDGAFVYAAGSNDHALVTLTRSADSTCPASGVGNISAAMDTEGVEVNIAANGLLKFTLQATVASDATNTLYNEAGVFSCPSTHTGPVSTCVGAEVDTTNNTDSDTNEINANADLSITKTDGVAQYNGLLGALNVSGNNDHVYVAAAQENAIGIFSRNNVSAQPEFGDLAYVNSVLNGQNGVSGLLGVADVLLSADGLTLYAAGAGDNAVVVFSRNPLSGELTFLEKQSSGLFGVEGLEGVDALAISADGAHLYATGPLTGSVSVFAIDQTGGVNQGRLSYQQKLQNAVAGVGGLSAVSDLVVAPDNQHVYAISNSENSISLFLRNPNSNSPSFGTLSYLNTWTNGNDGIGGLIGPTELLIESAGPGDHVYVLGAAAQALVVFARDTGTGALTFVEFKQNGTSQVAGLAGATDLNMSADGLHLYVAGQQQDSVVKFNRDVVTGSLEFAQIVQQGDPLGLPGEFVDGLDGASGIFLSPDGNHQYLASRNDHAVTTFEVMQDPGQPQDGMLSYQQSLVDGEGGVAPGSIISYVIVASNLGPSDAEKVLVQDIFPAEFEQISYQCFPINQAACNTNLQSGNVHELVDLPAGSRVEILATGVVRTDATGVLSNTATVSTSTDPAFAISDPDLSNNSATDDNTLLSPAVDLLVTKDNGSNTVIPGTRVTWDITVSNQPTVNTASQPSDALGVWVTDVVPEAVSNVNWTCHAFPEVGLLNDGEADDNNDNNLIVSDLSEYRDLVISDNGLFAYAVGQNGPVSELLVYARDQRTGELSLTQTIAADDAGVNGMSGLTAVTLSHDQQNLYAVSNVDDSLVVFDRDTATGVLAYAAVLTDGAGGVNGLGGATDVIISADDKHLYVAGQLDNAIAVFQRNLADGSMTYLSHLLGIDGLTGVNTLAFDQSGMYLLAVADLNQSLASFARNNATGALSVITVIQDFQITGTVLNDVNDVFVLNNLVYVTGAGSDALGIFELNDMDGSLSYQQSIALTAGDAPGSVVISENGAQLYVANTGVPEIQLYQQINGQYTLSGQTYGTTDVPELDGLNRLRQNQQRDFIYALSGDDLVLFHVAKGSSCGAQGNGSLSDVADIISGGFVTYQLSGDVLPTATGRLINSAQAVVAGDTLELNPADNLGIDDDLLVPTTDLSVQKSDGLNEVVAGTPLEYEINVFSAGPSSVLANLEDVVPVFPGENAGMLTGSILWTCQSSQPIQLNTTYDDVQYPVLSDVSAMLLNQTGDRVYITGKSNNQLSVFAQDISGQLTLLNTVSEGDDLNGTVLSEFTGITALALSADESHLYVTAESSNRLFVFAVADNGQLEQLQSIQSGSDGVIGMSDPVAIELAADGLGVYVAARGSDAITVFSRNTETGLLTFVERVRDGFGTIVPDSNVIIGINDLQTSPDGGHLYTTADGSDSIAIFERDSATQQLTYVGVIRGGDDQGGQTVPGLNGVNDMAFSPNGLFAYFLTADDQSLIYFNRNASTGELSYLNHLTDGDVGVGPLQNPAQLALSNDAGKLLVADAASSSVSLYERNDTDGSLTLEDVYYDDPVTGGLMLNPNGIVVDSTRVLVSSVAAQSLTTLRLVADAECPVSNGTGDVVNVSYEMNPGSSATTLISAMVHPSARGVISNTAVMSLPPGSEDSDTQNDTSTDLTTITIDTDVSVVKTGPTDAIAGERITYQIVLANTGPSDALGVQLTDTLDNALLDAQWTCVATGRSVCESASGNGDLDESLDVTIDGTITFEVDVLIDPGFFGTLDNTAEAVVFEAGFNTDRDLSNNISSVSTDVTQVADLVVSKVTLGTVTAGLAVDYQIVVSNSGPSDADNTTVTDMVPDELINVTWTCSADPGANCQATGTDDVLDVIDIPVGTSVTYLVNGMLPSAATGDLFNEVTVATGAPVTDDDLSNNTASVNDVILEIADLSVTIDDSIDPYDPDSANSIQYLVTLNNAGPSDARTITTDTVITGITSQVQIFDLISDCDSLSNGFSCTTDLLVAGGSLDTVVDLRYAASPPETVVLETVTNSSTATDPDLNNNTDVETTELITGIDVTIHKTDNLEFAEPGTPLTYLITVTNEGSVDAGDVVVNEQLPASLINASWTCEGFAGATCINIDSNNVTGGANLPAGSQAVFTLTTQIDPLLVDMSETEVVNVVDVQLVSGTDFNLNNNTDTDTNVLVFYIFIDGFEEVVE
ncbi:beta-propeller fold lactonase family protein [Marinicella sediminis]|uniref:Beta-propeller fold lactonase family protein n=1 Tax=Marinicella sediminis TaxID=1792834 RepID=A0ABV7JBW2_9GAMM|nr:beta-propeller fold lactonase family protein [Marinicella sediminis]